MSETKKAMLVILDGWGLAEDEERSAIAKGRTPFFDEIWKERPKCQLLTHGPHVGLPDGQMGNSEVGHLNIGAGRIVYQDLMLINNAIDSGEIRENEALVNLISDFKESGKKLHILGLLSDGGVHAHVDHLLGMLSIFENEGLENVFIHGFLDGRDTDPQEGINYVRHVEDFLADKKARLVSLVGRYYAMDRDQRWDRVKQAYDLLVHGKGDRTDRVEDYLRSKYDNGVTDEFMTPVKCVGDNEVFPVIEAGDHVLFYNYRTDRPRQLTEVLTQNEFAEYGMAPLDLHFYTMTEYDQHFNNVQVLFRKSVIEKTFGEVLSDLGMSQLRAAETEKYPHVTYFFNGGREEEFHGEERILVPSPQVATYDLQPEMSAYQLTEAVVRHMEEKQPDCVVINYANADMVGHTGDFSAAVSAVEAVDENLRKLTDSALAKDFQILVIADHGNADYMINDDGSPNTAHSLNPVPCILLGGEENAKMRNGILADVAPTLLKLMGVDLPEVMTGKALF